MPFPDKWYTGQYISTSSHQIPLSTRDCKSWPRYDDSFSSDTVPGLCISDTTVRNFPIFRLTAGATALEPLWYRCWEPSPMPLLPLCSNTVEMNYKESLRPQEGNFRRLPGRSTTKYMPWLWSAWELGFCNYKIQIQTKQVFSNETSTLRQKRMGSPRTENIL